MKRYVLIAGVNGAGKTTLYQTKGSWSDIPRVNIDEIVRETGSWKNKDDVFEAGKKAVALIREYFTREESFHQETTLCGKGIMKNIAYAKEHGYRVELFFVGLDSATTAKQRVAQRVRDGGHGIPDEDIERRYEEGLRNLINVIPACDRVEVFDNTFGFRKLACFGDGICINLEEYIPVWFERIRDKIDEQ